MSAPFFGYRQLSGAMPIIVTVNVTVWRAIIVWLGGCRGYERC